MAQPATACYPPGSGGAGLSDPTRRSPDLRSADGRWLAGILAAGLLIRIVAGFGHLAANPLAATPVNDAEVYWNWAEEIAGGRLVLDGEPFFSAPFYPYLLGLLRALGADLEAVIILQSLLDLATAWLLARTVRGRFGARTSLIAAALFLLLLEPVSSALRVLPSSWQLFFIILTYAAIHRFRERPDLASASGLGSAAGLLALAYAPALLLIPILGVWSWRAASERSRTRVFLALIGVAFAWIAPATLHNRLAVQEWILLQSGSGVTLLQGNQARSRGAYTAVEGISTHRDQMHRDAYRLVREQVGDQPTWNEVNRHWRDRAFAFWRDQPAAAIGLTARKLYWFIASKNYGEIYAPASEIRLGLNRALLAAPLPLPWIMGLSLLGLARWLRRPARHFPELLLTLLPLAIVLIFFFSPRYRLPAAPLLALAAACAVDRALTRPARPRNWMIPVLAVALGIALGPIHRATGFDQPMDGRQAQNLAFVLSRQGEVQRAVEWQQRGIELGSDGATAILDLGTLLQRAGREQEALEAYTHALTMAPLETETTLTVARQLLAAGRLVGAESVLAPAGRVKRPDPRILSLLAVVQFRQGRLAPAADTLRAAVVIAPEDLTLRRSYAGVLVELGRWQEALPQIEAILRALPGNREAESMRHRAQAGLASRDTD